MMKNSFIELISNSTKVGDIVFGTLFISVSGVISYSFYKSLYPTKTTENTDINKYVSTGVGNNNYTGTHDKNVDVNMHSDIKESLIKRFSLIKNVDEMKYFYNSKLVDAYLEKHAGEDIDLIKMGLDLEKYERILSLLEIYKIHKEEGYVISERVESILGSEIIESVLGSTGTNSIESTSPTENTTNSIESSSSSSSIARTISSDASHFRQYAYDRSFLNRVVFNSDIFLPSDIASPVESTGSAESPVLTDAVSNVIDSVSNITT